MNQRVAGSLPGQDTCLGYEPGPLLGVCEKPIDVPLTSVFLSLSFSLPSPLSKNKYIKSLKKTKKKVNYINKTSGKVGKIFVTNDKGLMSLI